MSGHNKWSKIKRKKGANDAKRSKAWARITRDIMIAARDSGGDPGMNARLALAIDKAKAENMPKDTIERAIKRGTGEIESAFFEETTYEGYGPGGVAVFVEVLTDNTRRSVADVRHVFSKFGGNLGTSGSVAYLFDRKGVIEIASEGLDELALFDVVAEAGAEDLEQDGDTYIVTAPVDAFGAVQRALRENEISPCEANVEYVATTTVSLAVDEAQKVVRLIEALEEIDDVQAVYTTLDFDEATLAAVS
jgi:YebC/PmpR family DNA-binding regulatory protein